SQRVAGLETRINRTISVGGETVLPPISGPLEGSVSPSGGRLDSANSTLRRITGAHVNACYRSGETCFVPCVVRRLVVGSRAPVEGGQESHPRRRSGCAVRGGSRSYPTSLTGSPSSRRISTMRCCRSEHSW